MYQKQKSSRPGYIIKGKKLNKPLPPIFISKEDELAQEKFENIIKGNFLIDEISERRPREVRLFLSSTFSDFKVERNVFIRKVLPNLKALCNDRGVDLRLCDMRWGVTDSAVNEHSVERLCLREIETCRQLSIGPFFVLFVGNRYGYQPLPNELPSSEFDRILEIITENYPKEKDVFVKWYVKDENSIPPKYILLPIKTYVQGYADVTDKSRHREAGHEWWLIEEGIRKSLRKSTKILVSKGEMSKKRRQELIRSVTETELAAAIEEDNEDIGGSNEGGLKKKKQNFDRCFVYQRSMTGLTDDLENEYIRKFIDYVYRDGEVACKSECVEALQIMKSRLSQMIFGQQRIYSVPWRWGSQGIMEQDEAHNDYLEKLTKNLISDLKMEINNKLDKFEKDGSRLDRVKDNLQYEVIFHWLFAKQRCEMFCGRQEQLASIHQELDQQQDNRYPIVVYGDSGSGKTALLGKLALEKLLNNRSGVLVVRFLGTSANSSTLYQVLYSVCLQIQMAYHLPVQNKKMRTLSGVVNLFEQLLLNVSKKYAAQIPLTIILDSLDQLEFNQSQKKTKQNLPLHWLPTKLPRGVSMIISIANDIVKESLFRNLQQKLSSSTNQINSKFIQINQLNPEDVNQLYENMTQRYSRKLNEGQLAKVMQYLLSNPQPLYIKLLLRQAFHWTSFQPISDIQIADSINGAVQSLFNRLESCYGCKFIQYTLSYVTLGLSGLSEGEIEDLLSLQDEVLNEVYEYHDPPIQGVVRIPSLLWSRVQADLKNYLVEKWTNGKLTLSWYHRQLVQCVQSRYLQEDMYKQLHNEMAQYYLIVGHYRQSVTLSNAKRTLHIPNADRLITNNEIDAKQPRRLQAIAYHILESGNEQKLVETCIMNFNFMVSFLQCFGLQELINWVSNCILTYPSNITMKIMKDCLVYLEPWININDIVAIAVQFLGFFHYLDLVILPQKSQLNISYLMDNLKILSKQCIELTNQKTSLIPSFCCYPTCLGSMKLYKERIWKIFPTPWLPRIIALVTYKQMPSSFQNQWCVQIFDMVDKLTIFKTHSLLEKEPINIVVPATNQNVVFVQDDRYVTIYEMETGHSEAQHGLQINGKILLNQCLAVDRYGVYIGIAAQNRMALLEYKSGEKCQIVYKNVLTAREVDKTTALSFPQSYTHSLLLSAHIYHSRSQKTFLVKLWQVEQANELWSLDLTSIPSQMIDTTHIWPVYTDTNQQQQQQEGSVLIVLSNGFCFYTNNILEKTSFQNLTNLNGNKKDNREKFRSLNATDNGALVVCSSIKTSSIYSISQSGELVIILNEAPINVTCASIIQSNSSWFLIGSKSGSVAIINRNEQKKTNQINQQTMSWLSHKSSVDFVSAQPITDNDSDSSNKMLVSITTYNESERVMKCWNKRIINQSESSLNIDQLFDQSILETSQFVSWSDNYLNCIIVPTQNQNQKYLSSFSLSTLEYPFCIKELPQYELQSNEPIKQVYSVLSNQGLILITESKVTLYNLVTGEIWSNLEPKEVNENIEGIWYCYDNIKSNFYILHFNSKTGSFVLNCHTLPNISHIITTKRFLPPVNVTHPQIQLADFEPIKKESSSGRTNHFVLFTFKSNNSPTVFIDNNIDRTNVIYCCLNLFDQQNTNLISCYNPEEAKKTNVKKISVKYANQPVYSVAYPIHPINDDTIPSDLFSESHVLIGGEGEIMIWNLITGNCRIPRVPYFHTWFRHSLVINTALDLNSSRSGSVRSSISGSFDKNPITALYVSSDCQLVVSGCSSGHLVTWWWINTIRLLGNEPESHCINNYRQILVTRHFAKINCITANKELNILLSGGADMFICMTCLVKNQILHRLRIHSNPINLHIPQNSSETTIESSKDKLTNEFQTPHRLVCTSVYLGQIRPMAFDLVVKNNK